MEKRFIQLFKILAKQKGFIKSDDLCQQLNIRPRTLREDIRQHRKADHPRRRRGAGRGIQEDRRREPGGRHPGARLRHPRPRLRPERPLRVALRRRLQQHPHRALRQAGHRGVQHAGRQLQRREGAGRGHDPRQLQGYARRHALGPEQRGRPADREGRREEQEGLRRTRGHWSQGRRRGTRRRGLEGRKRPRGAGA